MTTKTISVKSPQRNYDFYITVKVGDYDANLKGVPCTADLYIRNNGARFSSGGWTVSITADEEEHKDTDVSLNSTGVAMSGGQYNIKTISFIVSPSKTSFNVSAYISKSSYTTYDPGYCHLSGSIKMPQIQSLWAVGVLAVENVEGKFNLPINKFVDNYTNKVTISNLANDFIVKTIEDVENGQEVQFTQDELEKIYILDNNENSKILNFYLNLYTYSEDGTEIGIVQRLLANASLSNANPTLQFDVVEENAKVIELFGGNQNDSIVQNVSSLKFTITAEAFKGALVDSVKVNDNKVTPDDHNNYVIQLDKVQTDLFKIAVTDTRGYTANAEVKKTLLPYEPIKIKSFEFKRVSQISSEILLTADIICTSKSYNGINNIPEVYFKVGKDGSYIEIPNGFTFEDNTIKFDKYKLSQELEYNQEASYYLLIKDLFSSAEDSKVVGRGVHTFEAGKEDFRVNGKFYIANNDRTNVKEIRDLIYPVGSIYLSVNDVNPSDFFGGTWVAWGSGRVPVGVDTNDEDFSKVEQTGGEKTHKLTASEIPRHNHTMNTPVFYNSEKKTGYDIYGQTSSTTVTISRGTSYVGGDGAHNNVQPYITCYMWKRIK